MLPKNIQLSKITYGTPRALDNGGKVIYVGIENKPLILQTPEMTAPFGLSKWSADSKGPDKYTLELSFKGRETRPNIDTFYHFAQDLDRKLVGDAMDNSMAWLKKKFTSREVLEALYTPMLKFAKDKTTGEITDKYPPTFRLTLPNKDGRIAVDAYDANREPIDLSSLELKGARVTAIVQCMGIWIAGGKFGCSWKAIQLKVLPQASIRGFAFRDVEGEGGDLPPAEPAPAPAYGRSRTAPQPLLQERADVRDALDDEVYVPTSEDDAGSDGGRP